MKIQDITAAVGLESPSYFARVFKRLAVSPRKSSGNPESQPSRDEVSEMRLSPRLQSIYTKMVFTLFVAVLPFYLIVLRINHSDAEGVRQRITESISAQAHYYLSSLEAKLEQVIKFQQQLAVNTVWIRSATHRRL